MNFLKTIGILLFIFVLVLCTIGFIQPKNYLVKRSTEINAPIQEVHKKISSWKSWEKWSPWVELDTAMYTKIGGLDGTIGSRYNWKSNNPDVGTGNMVFTDFKKDKVGFKINLQSPFNISQDAYFIIKENSKGNTHIIWSLNGESSFFERIASVFWNMDAMVGPDLEKGLRNLKNLVESERLRAIHSRDKQGIRVEEFTFEETIYLTNKIKIVPLEEAISLEYYYKEVKDLFAYANEYRINIIGPPARLIYSKDTIKKRATIAIGLPIDSIIDNTLNHPIVEIKQSKAAKYTNTWMYDELPLVNVKLRTHLMVKGLKQIFPTVVIFNINPEQEPNPEKWKTSVIYLHE